MSSLRDPNDLVAQFAVDGDLPEEAAPPAPVLQDWEPPTLGEAQKEAYRNDTAMYLLMSGERGSGKSWCAAHKLVRHCYREQNALAIVIVGIKRQALEGGIWDKICRDVLPMWKDAVGLSYTETKSNIAKDFFLYVSNRHGGWSRILLLSMPVDSYIGSRVKGMEPSFVLIDEAQTLASDDYFSKIVQQLGRRQSIHGTQQYVATANPDGKSHWLYKRFYEMPVDKKTGQYNPDYATYHVPIGDNIQNLPQFYYDRVIEAVRDDPVEYRRMVLGEWIDRPTGAAIFKDYYNSNIHVRGNPIDETRILPKVGHDIVLGYDLGTANSAIVFLQEIPTDKGSIWLAFDEMIYVDRYISYPVLVPAILRRLQFWNDTMHTTFRSHHISDSSAFNQFRATDGTYDSLEVERLSTEIIKEWPDLRPIQMIPAPKFSGSVAGRVKLVMKLLLAERLLVSSSCETLQQMFIGLESEKVKDNKYDASLPFTPKRSRHLHAFDALSYPLFYHELGHSFEHKAPLEFVPLGTRRAR